MHCPAAADSRLIAKFASVAALNWEKIRPIDVLLFRLQAVCLCANRASAIDAEQKKLLINPDHSSTNRWTAASSQLSLTFHLAVAA